MAIAADRFVLLTEEGIRDGKCGALIETPFGELPVTIGDAFEDRVAVIVDRSEIWTRRGASWERVAEADIRLNCIRWTRQ